MTIQHYKFVFVAVGLIGLLLMTIPAFSLVWHSSPGQEFSDLYLLGPRHELSNYPFNVVADQNYSIYVGVDNHLVSSAYYILYVKFGDLADIPKDTPISVTSYPSLLSPLFEYRLLSQSGNNSELHLTFSISGASFSSNQSTIKTLTINGETFNVNATTKLNTEYKNSYGQPFNGFYYQLIIELWVYNPQSHSIAYDNNYVNLPLNFTSGVPFNS